MTILLQILTFVLLVACAAAWGRWVHDTQRSIDAPEHMAAIELQGLGDNAAAAARSLGVGIVGQLGEHRRLVEHINTTAGTDDGDGLRAGIRVSHPSPELIRAPAGPKEPLNLSFELAGSKIDASGLQRFFGTRGRRGGMPISGFLSPNEDGGFTGLVSATFAERPEYGFSLPVKGTMAQITHQVALRFVQAHYATEDAFFAALQPEDFRKIWDARRIAPAIAIRWDNAGQTGSDDLRAEAGRAYSAIEPVVRRYTARTDLQTLAAYFASVAESYDDAITHLNAARAVVTDEDAQARFDRQIAQLEADRDRSQQKVAAVARTSAAAETDALIVLPAGNDAGIRDMPAPDGVLVVGAADGMVRAPYSNEGPGVDLFAPGTLATYEGDTIREVRGTTYAAAAATAVAANVLSRSGNSTSADLKAATMKLSTDANGIRLLTPDDG